MNRQKRAKPPELGSSGDPARTRGINVSSTPGRGLDRELEPLGIIASGISHEIGGPLFVIRTAIAKAQEDLEGLKEQLGKSQVDESSAIIELTQMMSFINYSTDRIASIVDGLRYLAERDDSRQGGVNLAEVFCIIALYTRPFRQLKGVALWFSDETGGKRTSFGLGSFSCALLRAYAYIVERASRLDVKDVHVKAIYENGLHSLHLWTGRPAGAGGSKSPPEKDGVGLSIPLLNLKELVECEGGGFTASVSDAGAEVRIEFHG